MVSIENTIEYSAWQDKLSYAEYEIACEQVGIKPLWRGAFSVLCTAFGRQKAFNELFGEENNDE